jgi:hypothetical protein
LDFLIPVFSEIQDLRQDALHRSTFLPAPAEGNDAVGAKIVAAFHDRDISADAAFPKGLGGPDLVPGAVPARLEEFAFPLLGEERGEFVVMIGADNDVDLGPFFKQVLAAELGDAAEDTDKPVPVLLERGEAAEEGIDLIFRFLPHGAGVDEDDIALFGRSGLRGPGPDEESRNVLGVVLVHLTAERLDEKIASFEVRGHVPRL